MTVGAPAQRFRDGPLFLETFADEVLVRCPRCLGCARVVRGERHADGRVVCEACGFTRGPARREDLWLGPVCTWAERPCGVCGRRLRRRFGRGAGPPQRRTVHLSCPGCGSRSEAELRWAPMPVGEPHDRLSGLPLWLQAPFRGHLLWALNARHLEWLRGYVGAALRERTPHVNRSLASRLPGWVKAGRSRESILRLLDRMEAMLPPGRAG